jgi:hypothetical protein
MRWRAGPVPSAGRSIRRIHERGSWLNYLRPLTSTPEPDVEQMSDT